ncbi:MAG: winged helix-turn-helix transcriptional regulator [Candidatus Thermoplasmatota archaeon]|nr:winged helix-turn-helix transcriptional regulator [Candidatus Thermoplasmatota archaeon]MCG2827607.1 winged helix-turn-helix transcriptional regulator [Thermoplasmatales archaeon]
MSKIIKLIGYTGNIDILKQLHNSRKSYTQLENIVKLSGRTLSKRLKELTDEGLIKRKLMDNRRVLYSITEKGKKTIEKLQEIEKI